MLKRPLQFSAAYGIGLESALQRALRAAGESGDISFLMSIDAENSRLFPSYHTIIRQFTPLRLGNIDPIHCTLHDDGLSVPVICRARPSRLPSFSLSHILRRFGTIPYQIQDCSGMDRRHGHGTGGPARWRTAEGHSRVH
jgi:hypothetical protein